MSVKLPNGAIVSFSTALAAALTVTAASNANPAELTVTNSLTDGDIVVFNSGWSKADNRVFRIDNSDGDSVNLEGFNASNTSLYPAGSGAGSLLEVTTWQQLTQILEWNYGGGDIQTGTYQFLESDAETEFSTVAAASYIDVMLADDVTNAGYLALKAISDVGGETVLRVALKNGEKLFYKVGVFVNPNPSMTKNELMGIMARLSIKSEVVRYAS